MYSDRQKNLFHLLLLVDCPRGSLKGYRGVTAMWLDCQGTLCTRFSTFLFSESCRPCSFNFEPLQLVQPTEPWRSRHKKAELAEALLEWRLQQPETQDIGSSTSTECGHALLAEEIEEIWSDIDQLLTPSWMTSGSVPSQIGSSSHGKPKADQWCLSLTRLWGFQDDGSPRSVRCLEILDVTVSLISAVVIATSHRYIRQCLCVPETNVGLYQGNQTPIPRLPTSSKPPYLFIFLKCLPVQLEKCSFNAVISLSRVGSFT
jgi:hypothetical protein